MRVRNLESWAGENFAYVAGDEIELPDKVAQARIEAGLAEPIGAEQGELPLGGEGAKSGSKKRKS